MKDLERIIYEGEVKKKMVDAIQLQTAKDQGMQLLLVQQMTRRMGDVPASISSKLQRLNADALSELGLDLLDFTSYTDVENWLTRH